MQHMFWDKPLEANDESRPATPAEFTDLVLARARGMLRDHLEDLSKPKRATDIRMGNAELRTWWHQLDTRDREIAEYFAKHVAHATLHTLFAILDGVAAVEPIGPKGHFELAFVRDGVRHPLVSPESTDFLHDTLNAVPQEWIDRFKSGRFDRPDSSQL